MRRHARTAGLLAALLAMCLLCACQEKQEPLPEDGTFLYFVESHGGTGSVLGRELYSGSEEPTVRVLVNALLAGPGQESLISPFPAHTTLLGWSLVDGLLTLNLSEHYGDLSGIDLTMADYCITLTLCQIERVKQVQILVAGDELAYREHKVMEPSEAVLEGPMVLTVEGREKK